MAVKKLIEVWDGINLVDENINFLKQKTKQVRIPFNENINNILKDLLDTYKSIPCAGVAANQIGYNYSIFIGLKEDRDDESEKNDIIGNPHSDNYEFYINPEIYHTTKKSTQEGEEGCLSIPDIRIMAERFDKIKVKYYNKNGRKIKKPLKGFMSRLFQHELDHLNGVLMVENSKIKSAYKISENEHLESLYTELTKKILQK